MFGIWKLLHRLSQLMHLTRVRAVTLTFTILTATLQSSNCAETPNVDVQRNEMDYRALNFAGQQIPNIGDVPYSEKTPLTPIFAPTSLLSNLVTNNHNNRNSNNDKDDSTHIVDNISTGSSARNQRNNRQSDKSTTQLSSRIIHTRNGAISGVIVRLDARNLDPVEAFRGIPYASPPVGNLRFMPPVSAALWPGVKKAKNFGPVCPQRLPDISNETAALEHMSKGRFEYLKRLIPYLQNQSEDCLHLNIYVPIQVASREIQNANNSSSGAENSKIAYTSNQSKYAVLVFVHGESYEWNSGNPYEGSVLASYGQILVVTINYRLGVLGFMNANTDRYTKLPANYGLMDIIAALHWLKENIAAFGGDPNNITLAGHGTGAACVHFLMSSMAVPEGSLFNRAILMSGSGITPWSIVRNPAEAAAELANQLNCPSNLPQVHLMKCLREKPVEELVKVSLKEPQFGFKFGPTIDGVVIDGGDVALPLEWTKSASQFYQEERNDMSAEDATQALTENSLLMRKTALNKLSGYDVMAGVTRAEAFLKFNSADVQYGFEADRRSQILKAFIRDTYTYHLNEIYATIVNEYTDWERPVQHPINIRDETLEALGDAQVVAATVRTMDLHSSAHRNSYFYVFDYQTRYGDYPQRQGCIHGEDIPYVFGAPLVGGFNHFTKNFTKSEINLSEITMMYWSNFARTGNPNEPSEMGIGNRQDRSRLKLVEWTAYESNHKKYLNFDIKPKLKNHFRAHRLSFWLNLIPELHKQGGDNVPEHHHQLNLKDDNKDHKKIKNTAYSSQAGITALSNFSLFTNQVFSLLNYTSPALQRNKTYYSADDHSTDNLDNGDPHGGAMSSYDNDGFAAYSTALSATIAIGCSLLILNVLIFAGVYYQRDKIRLSEARTHTNKNKKQENVQVLNNICGEVETSNLHVKNDSSNMLPKHHALLHHQITPPDFTDMSYRVPPAPKHAKDMSPNKSNMSLLPMMNTQCGIKKSCMKQQTSLSHIGHQTAKSATVGGLNVCSSASTLSGDCTLSSSHQPQCLNSTNYATQSMGLMDELCV